MIILRLEAERLHRYRVLRLADLPERGIIGLSGDNESGKSAIGEIICFALFGRTFALPGERIGKLVHWGAGEGAVTLRFRVKGKVYEVSRNLTRDGAQSARLIALEAGDEPLARADGVTPAIARLVGFGFDDYVETCYLAQREIASPHPHSPAVRAMVGAAPLQACATALDAELGEAEAAQAARRERRLALAEELAQLAPEAGRGQALERQLAEIGEREAQLAERMQALQGASDAYSTAYRRHGSHGARRALAGLLANIALLAVLAVGAIWAMLHFQPATWPMPVLIAWLEGLIAETGLTTHAVVTAVMVIFGGFLLLTWLWLAVLASGLRRRRARARRLARELDRLDSLEPLPARLREAPGAGSLVTAGDGGEAVASTAAGVEGDLGLVIDRPDVERRARLRQRILFLEAAVAEVCSALEHEAVWLKRDLERLHAWQAATRQGLARLRSEGQRHQAVIQELAKLDQEILAAEEWMATRRLARDLLVGAARDLSRRFSSGLRDMVSRALPRFTEGHYEFLEVDEDLQVRVYSSDKRNLLDLDEISSGTQRQIMLALRLGLAQELVARRVRDDQFVFLDEPFAFFDSRRLRGALKNLSELGGELTQYWVVAQRFPQDAPIGLEIACGQHPDTLTLGFPEVS